MTWTGNSRVGDRAVINASPLIFLARGGHLGLLRAVAGEVWVPETVAGEIRQRGSGDVTAQALMATDWLVVKPVPVIGVAIAEWRLGAGESATVALALMHGLEAIIDDLAGRKCAASLGVPLRGTLGIVLAAKQRGLIPAARPVIEDLVSAGLYLSRGVLDRALRRVGE
jgi:predicted nucleic acid-binding protein